MMPDAPPSSDVVVVGGGHNGLIAACYLARAGHRVVVVEAAPTIGGMTTSGALIAEAPQHTIHPCAVELIMLRATTIVADLELRRHGLRTLEPDPAYVYLHPDGSTLAFWRDPARTARELARFSRADAGRYVELARVLESFLAIGLPLMRSDVFRPGARELRRALGGALRHRGRLGEVAALASSSADQAVAERFQHPVAASALLALAAGAGPIEGEGSALSLILLGLLHGVGVSRPAGGMQRFVDALVSCLEEAGGEVRAAAPVAEVVIRGGRAAGVRLADGREIGSRAVVATCDPHTTLRRLVPEGTLAQPTLARVDRIPANAAGASPMKVDVALSGRVSVPAHTHPDVDLRVPTLLYGTADDTRASFQAAAGGKLPASPLMWAAVPTGCDPSQAPSGQDVVYLYPPAMPVWPGAGWQSLRGPAERLILGRAEAFLGGLRELELGRWVETPEEMAERTRARNGCIVHVDFSPFRSGPVRPAWGLGSYETPVNGLFLGGAGSHPGGGVSGLPGRLSAARVRRYLASENGTRRRPRAGNVFTPAGTPPPGTETGDRFRTMP